MCFPFHYIFHNSPAQSESRQNDCIPIVSGESREVLLTPGKRLELKSANLTLVFSDGH